MKRFIKSILLFIPFIIAMYILLVCIWGEWGPGEVEKNLNYRIGSYGHTYSRLQEVKRTKNIDILFLGSSLSYRGFDVRIFKNAGHNTFNLGSSAQTPIQTEALLERYLDELNPKTIIYEVYPAFFSSDGIESSLDIIGNDQTDLESFKMALKLNHIEVYNTLAYGFYRDIFDKNSTYNEKTRKKNDTYIDGGFVEKDLEFFEYIKYEKDTWEFNDEQFNSFKNILKLIEGRNIELILIQAPTTPSRYRSYTNNIEFDNRIKMYGDYFNFNEIVALDDSLHFYDPLHLNQNGVIVFNTKLIEVLFDEKFSTNAQAIGGSPSNN